MSKWDKLDSEMPDIRDMRHECVSFDTTRTSNQSEQRDLRSSRPHWLAIATFRNIKAHPFCLEK